ncbi:MAG: hypothetical protein FRX48_03637 [Lasallia pustulata]|uniref:Uncharacterized protein n=1 Tax=Lasallia pustulata TaxID=136370 RepID=A0A5M8PUI3_9LECA|nr:MAG: hypothetical protein FRX48_03637 [Lasallia pustulata]
MASVPQTPANTAPTPVAATPITVRSAQAPPHLTLAICLRCSKYLSDKFVEQALTCNMNVHKCARCSHGHKVCDDVPEKSLPVVNQLCALAVQVQEEADEDGSVAAALKRRLKRYGTDVTAFTNKAKKFGGYTSRVILSITQSTRWTIDCWSLSEYQILYGFAADDLDYLLLSISLQDVYIVDHGLVGNGHLRFASPCPDKDSPRQYLESLKFPRSPTTGAKPWTMLEPANSVQGIKRSRANQAANGDQGLEHGSLMDPLTTAAAPRIAMNVLMVKTLKTSPLSDLLRSPKRPSAGEESMWEAEMPMRPERYGRVATKVEGVVVAACGAEGLPPLYTAEWEPFVHAVVTSSGRLVNAVDTKGAYKNNDKLSGRLERLRFDRSQERLEVAEEDREGEEGDDEDADDDVFL